MPSPDGLSCFDRLLKVCECDTPTDLAEKFDIRRSVISDMQRLDYVDFSILYKLHLKGINPNYVMTGVGEPELPRNARWRLLLALSEAVHAETQRCSEEFAQREQSSETIRAETAQLLTLMSVLSPNGGAGGRGH